MVLYKCVLLVIECNCGSYFGAVPAAIASVWQAVQCVVKSRKMRQSWVVVSFAIVLLVRPATGNSTSESGE